MGVNPDELSITHLLAGKVNYPYLYDYYGKPLDENSLLIVIESYFSGEEVLNVIDGVPANLTLEYDMASSTHWIPMDDNEDAIDLSISPTFRLLVKKMPQEIRGLFATINNIEGHRVSLRRFHNQEKEIENDVWVTGANTKYIVDSKQSNAHDFSLIFAASNNVVAHIDASKNEDGYVIQRIDATTDKETQSYLYGVLEKDKKFLGNITVFDRKKNSSYSIFVDDFSLSGKEPKESDRFFSAFADKDIKIKSHSFLNEWLVGEVDEINGSEATVIPLSVNGVDTESTGKAVTLTTKKEVLKEYNVKKDDIGKFLVSKNKADYKLVDYKQLNTENMRLSATLPLLSTAQLISSLSDTKITLEEKLSDDVMQTQYIGYNLYASDLSGIKTIDIAHARLVIKACGILPSELNLQYNDSGAFIKNVKHFQENDFHVSGVTAEGELKNGIFYARDLVLQLVNHAELTETLDMINNLSEKGAQIRGMEQIDPLLHGPALRKFKKLFGVFSPAKSSIAKNVLSESIAHSVSSKTLSGDLADALSKSHNSKILLSEKTKTFRDAVKKYNATSNEIRSRLASQNDRMKQERQKRMQQRQDRRKRISSSWSADIKALSSQRSTILSKSANPSSTSDMSSMRQMSIELDSLTAKNKNSPIGFDAKLTTQQMQEVDLELKNLGNKITPQMSKRRHR